LWISALIVFALTLSFKAKRAGNIERIGALQSEFERFTQSISAQMSTHDGNIWQVVHSDRLTRITFESLCGRAVTTIRGIRGLRRSFPGHIWHSPDNVSIWVSILDQFGLRERSAAEKLYPQLPSRYAVFDQVQKASVEGCRRIKDLLS
jgi:hypothetical protein